jgi:hypothetical protein
MKLALQILKPKNILQFAKISPVLFFKISRNEPSILKWQNLGVLGSKLTFV